MRPAPNRTGPIQSGSPVPSGRALQVSLSRTADRITGATYRITDVTTVDDPGGRQLREEFVARPGEAVELGDIVIAKPES